MRDNIRSLVFDFFQIGSDVFIIFTGPIFTSNPLVIFFQLLAAFIMLDAAWEMRRTKYYRIPDVGKQNELVTSGIYRYVRNPMYLSQLLFCGVLIINSLSLIRFIVYLVLLTNFIQKIQYEEKLLHANFPEFDAYKKRSWRLLPYIF